MSSLEHNKKVNSLENYLKVIFSGFYDLSEWLSGFFSFYCETDELEGAATINFDPVTEIGGESIRLGQHGGQPHRSAFFGRQKGKAVWVGGWRMLVCTWCCRARRLCA